MSPDLRTVLKRVWHFIWDDNSIWSWIVNVLLAFVLIKFVVYPGLGLAFQTSHPVVAVVSGSMEHPGGFDTWWKSNARCTFAVPCAQGDYYREQNITLEQFKDFAYPNGFNTGDIMVLYGKPADEIEAGDVIVFQSGKPDPIIHRVIKVYVEDDEIHFHTKGDHNEIPINRPDLNELRVPESTYIGKAVFRIPYLGWIKIAFVEMISWIM